MNKYSAEEIEEHRAVMEWCLAVIDFKIERRPEVFGAIYQSTKKNLRRAFERSDFRGLRAAYRDFIEEIKGESIQSQRALDTVLREKFGSGLDEVFAESDRKADKILKRGKIKNEDEFYFLREYFESIWEDDKQRERAALIDEMLAEFEKREE
ncbi:MAG: hypothetical protein RBT76_09925 [candidate division Zixibacteria bacterium]|jgi:hypothetical protein|nr:hypothetical protein [candidate division Zixibacteria bacterium]